MTTPQIEARAYELHQTRKANSARNYPWAPALTFDGGERDYCMTEARYQLANERDRTDRVTAEDRWFAGVLAAMSDAQIATRLVAIDERIASLPFRPFTVNIADRGAGLADERRRLVAEQAARAVPAMMEAAE